MQHDCRKYMKETYGYEAPNGYEEAYAFTKVAVADGTMILITGMITVQYIVHNKIVMIITTVVHTALRGIAMMTKM